MAGIVGQVGYVIEDSSDFTSADFEDACIDHSVEEACMATFEGYFCSRKHDHTGPHAAATGPDSITAIWEDKEL